MAQHLPADHSKGDANTIGGYMAVHARPAAFEGPDGFSYSVALEVDETGERARPWGAFFLFVRWRRLGASGVEGHLESEFLEWGATAEETRARLGAWPLADVKRVLDGLVRASSAPARRWWDAMRDGDAE